MAHHWYLWTFLSLLKGVISNCPNSANVLPVCTTARRRGHSVSIDTSAVPVDKLITCYCSVHVYIPDYSYHITYNVANSPNCEIQFLIGNNRYCGPYEDLVTWEKLDGKEIKFEKTLLGRDSTACLTLEILPPDRDPDQPQIHVTNGTLQIDCEAGTDAREPVLPPETATMHSDQHGTLRPPDHVHDNQADTSHQGATFGSVGQCPACNCPACNCPDCNCPTCHCSPDGTKSQRVIEENFTEGHSTGVLIGCSVGLFVAGCIIGILVTLAISYFRSNRYRV